MSGVSKSQVSRLCGELDERVGTFLNRQIEGDWPYLWMVAIYVKTSETGRIVSVAVVAQAGQTDGWCRARRARVHVVSVRALDAGQFDKSAGAAERSDQAKNQCSGHLPK